MNDKDNFREHVTEMMSSISEQVKNIKENVQEMKGLFNKMCDKLSDNCTKTVLLEERIGCMEKERSEVIESDSEPKTLKKRVDLLSKIAWTSITGFIAILLTIIGKLGLEWYQFLFGSDKIIK